MAEKIRLYLPVPKGIRISSGFGPRVINGKPQQHNGIDFATPVGTEIYAAADGVVYRAGWENPSVPKQGYGLRIMQRADVGDKKLWIWYGHANELLVSEGEKVKAGQVIAKSGNTGRSSGPHLHIGARDIVSLEFYDIEFEDRPNV